MDWIFVLEAETEMGAKIERGMDVWEFLKVMGEE